MATSFTKEEILKSIADQMYSAGNDYRSVKGGNPAVLAETAGKNSQFSTLGVFASLPENYKALIDDKDLYTKMTDQDKKVIFQFLLRHANTFTPGKYCVYMSKVARDTLDDFINDREILKSNRPILELRKWFVDQDRKKSTGGSVKKGSNFSYIAASHAEQTKDLQNLNLRGRSF
jgi:hypothetical protein